MKNSTWIDPRQVDWSDAFNPLSHSAWHEHTNPFMFQTLNQPIWQALRNAPQLEPRIVVIPDPLNQTVAAGYTYTQDAAIEPYTWLFAVSCAAFHADGSAATPFSVQITDANTGASVFSQPILSSAVAATNGKGILFFLPTPILFLPPSYPIVTITNNDALAAVLTVNLFTAVEVN